MNQNKYKVVGIFSATLSIYSLSPRPGAPWSKYLSLSEFCRPISRSRIFTISNVEAACRKVEGKGVDISTARSTWTWTRDGFLGRPCALMVELSEDLRKNKVSRQS